MQLCCNHISLLSFFCNMNFKINWDTLGIATSLACAIHCALLPLIFTSLPVFGINVIENFAFEISMVVLAFAIGIYSLYHGYKKHHHNLLPIAIFTTGFMSLILKLFFAEYENWLLLPAVIGIIAAHLINFRLCRIHNHAHAKDCAH